MSRGEEERYQEGFPHLHRQCLTSVAVARPPRDESITLNNVNVSPSQHKTNNHCSLPRPMGTASTRGSPVPHSPLASLVSTPRRFSAAFLLLFLRLRLSYDLVYVASLKSRRSSARTYVLSRERRRGIRVYLLFGLNIDERVVFERDDFFKVTANGKKRQRLEMLSMLIFDAVIFFNLIYFYFQFLFSILFFVKKKKIIIKIRNKKRI